MTDKEVCSFFESFCSGIRCLFHEAPSSEKNDEEDLQGDTKPQTAGNRASKRSRGKSVSRESAVWSASVVWGEKEKERLLSIYSHWSKLLLENETNYNSIDGPSKLSFLAQLSRCAASAAQENFQQEKGRAKIQGNIEEEETQAAAKAALLARLAEAGFETANVLTELSNGSHHGYGAETQKSAHNQAGECMLYSKFVEDWCQKMIRIETEILSFQGEGLTEFGSRLKHVAFRGLHGNKPGDAECFLDNIATCLGKKGPQAVLRIIFDCCHSDGSGGDGIGRSSVEAMTLMNLCYILGVLSLILEKVSESYRRKDGSENSISFPSEHALEPPLALEKSLLEFVFRERKELDLISQDPQVSDSSCVSFDEFHKWQRQSFPYLPCTLSAFMKQLLFPDGLASRPSDHEFFSHPQLMNQTSFVFSSYSQYSFALACVSPSLGGKVSVDVGCSIGAHMRTRMNSVTYLNLLSVVITRQVASFVRIGCRWHEFQQIVSLPPGLQRTNIVDHSFHEREWNIWCLHIS